MEPPVRIIEEVNQPSMYRLSFKGFEKIYFNPAGSVCRMEAKLAHRAFPSGMAR